MEKQQQTSAAAPLCANRCGFFGSAATKNLCSKCYRDHLKDSSSSSSSASSPATATAAAAPADVTSKIAVKKEEENSKELCANGCGFFGSKETNSLCSNSKCYRDHLKSSSMPLPPAIASAPVDVAVTATSLKGKEEAAAASTQDVAASLSSAAPPPAKPTRCVSCKKKVGLLGFECRCGGMFCSVHRYADKHACTHDFKKTDREKIAKENPLAIDRADDDSGADSAVVISISDQLVAAAANMAEQQHAAAAGGPALCANGCGFFGSAATKNLCSKCYRDHLKAASPSLPAIATVPDVAYEIKSAAAVTVTPSTSLTATTTQDGAAPAPPAKPNRCASCKKNVGLLGFECRCGGMFCSVHRYADKHACTHDFEKADREKIAKENPLVVASKINKF
uniref:AN1-type domain-containing protein n=1 Tax=Leersia perrieri TaxID=77586 RepID=A0A0D9X878_9ORYZ